MRTCQHVCPEPRKALAQHVARKQFEIEALLARLCGVFLQLADVLGPVAETDADMAVLQVLDICAEQFVRLPPYPAGTIGQRQLRDRPPLTAHVAEVGAACLPPDLVGLEQDDRKAALRQKERGGAAHQPATDDRDIGCQFRRAHASVLAVPTGMGLTGACPRKRPARSTASPRRAETISAEALPQ